MSLDRYSCVYLHYVQNRYSHRLRFGIPQKVITLDKRRKIACFLPDQIIGYSRWSGAKYGTVDWRIYIARTGYTPFLSSIPGIYPAARILLAAQGKTAVKRCLTTLDKIESQLEGPLETVPESYWICLSNALLTKQSPPELPGYLRKKEVASC